MDILEFQNELFRAGKESGFTEMEIYYSSNKSLSVNVHKQEIDEYNIAETGGVSFRGLFNGQMGYSYAEKIDLDSISLILEEALSNAKVLEIEEGEDLYEGSEEYPPNRPFSEELEQVEADKLIEAAFEMEQTAYDLDDRVQLVQYCYLTKNISEIFIANSKGLHCHEKTAYVSGGLYLVANDGQSTATGGESDYTLTEFSKLNFKKIARKAVDEAVSKLGADSIETGKYPIIFRDSTATELIGSFLGLLTAENVQKGYSKFAGKLGEQVAGENFTLIDDPLMQDVPGYITFDSEGFATKCKAIIKNGQLMTFMHNRKTAKKDGIESTGNAMKSGYRGTISVGPYNLYLQPGNRSLDEMISTIDKGILIVELQGANAGINTVAGDFSLAAIGFLIEYGKVVRPVDQITVSGNFFDLIHNIEEVGNDLRILGSVTSPSIKVKPLLVSGNKNV
ncbi:TldD/PmbA family protein [Lederbergia wuyishanensis]|uniref:PmbA protein n=1 Tax=Lederbergia wuyishanensis TaxID=1347903 RepID=A0ABU0D874_9BACI|nr:TldD/PmbA family protein [Lederbergia wuyishanensis]MCJ8009251.1 TldD/PmbA family protein [Lederbergia wuyishanensis]MDQ0344616.1 PmbA protein [Lederbergia wuyishanensis]